MDKLDEYLECAAEQYQPSRAQAARMMGKIARAQQKARREAERAELRRRNEEMLCWMKGLFSQPFERAFSDQGK